MKKIIKWFNNIIFVLTNILFSFIPVAMILGGSLAILAILMGWFFSHAIRLSDIWFIFLGLLITLMGFKWDAAVIANYPTAIARKKNTTKHKYNQRD